MRVVRTGSADSCQVWAPVCFLASSGAAKAHLCYQAFDDVRPLRLQHRIRERLPHNGHAPGREPRPAPPGADD